MFNVNAIKSGELEFGMTQSDIQFNATKGEAQFKGTADRRSARGLSRCIRSRSRWWRARKPASPSSRTSRASASTSAIPAPARSPRWKSCSTRWAGSKSDFSLAAELKADEQGTALCDNKIDGFFYGVGHPSAAIQDPTTACGAKLIPLTGPAVDKLVKRVTRTTPSRHDPGRHVRQQSRIRRTTYGVLATLVTSAKVPDDIVYALVKAVFDNFDEFKKLHPAFANLDPKEMVKDGLSAPLHPGAVKYYKEKGWM